MRTDYADFIEVRATGSGRSSRVAGALLAEGHPRVVRIGDFRLDVVPRGVLVLLRNRDVPGVIGRVGSLLGDAGINIAEYHQARLSAGGKPSPRSVWTRHQARSSPHRGLPEHSTPVRSSSTSSNRSMLATLKDGVAHEALRLQGGSSGDRCQPRRHPPPTHADCHTVP